MRGYEIFLVENQCNNITDEKQKIIILYSACFYHYYSMYRYKTNNVNFEDFLIIIF